MLIGTVTLDPAIDYLLSPGSFSLGTVNRCGAGVFQPGGKGINVSLLLSSLGMETRAFGFAAGFTGRELARLVEERGCPADLILLQEGCTRVNVKVRTPGGEETDLNGQSPEIPLQALGELEEKLSCLGPGDMAVLSGRAPDSLPRDVYAGLVQVLSDRGVKAVVDATGQAFLQALPRRPFLVKPNLEELEELFSTEIPDVATAKEYARELQRLGAQNVAVSMGAKGALLVGEAGEALFCHGLRGETASTVGAGDSFIAGLLFGLKLYGDLPRALPWAVAAGGATAFSQGIATGEDVKRLFPQVGTPHPV